MSKEELLKYLIAEIDLIMHDKDYTFENANGTWYSRESCRDLTNEEVCEELRTELRQFADLEAKLAESEKSKESYRLQNEHHHLQLLQFYSRLGVEAFGADIHEKALETLMIMKEQLAEKEKEIENIKLCRCGNCTNEYEFMLEGLVEDLEKQIDKNNQDKISFAVEKLEQVKEEILPEISFDVQKEFVKKEIDNQIKQLKGEVYE